MASDPDRTSDHVPDALPFSVGDVVGSYRLVRHIHAGGFGQVWLGRHLLVPGDRRAVKVFRDDNLGAVELDGIRRYRRVADSQPGLVPVPEIGLVPGKGYYYTMPLADDVNGRAVVRDADEYEPMTLQRYREMHRPAPIDRVLGVALHLLPALHALHEAGLVHRDVKPANIVRVEGQWKLCDLGLLARRDEIKGSCGTRGFIPPEGTKDRRADLYAFGVTLFVLASGATPADLLAFQERRLPLPGTDDRREALGDVIRKACHPDADQRYQAALDMHFDVNRLVRTTKLTIVLDDHFASFTPARLEEFVRAVRERGFHIHGIPVCAEGSVRITLELTPDEAEELADAVEAGEFTHFRAVRAELAGPWTLRGERGEGPGRVATGAVGGYSPQPRPEQVLVDEDELRTGPGQPFPPSKAADGPPTDPPTVVPASPGYGAPTIRGYEMLAELGRGGFGAVYKARQRGTNRLVALKLLVDTYMSSGQAAEQARRSAEALARVQHPNIVQIFEAGEHDGKHFCALELCLGGSLDQRLRRGPLGPDEAAGLVETLARAIDALHQTGALHRDLKPSNVLFSGPTPKIAGFALAATLDDLRDEATGVIAGTPSYMSPEQAGGAAPLTPAVDVYGLGAVLYECLTGRPPFRADNPLETIRQVTDLEPAAPRQLNPKVPSDLEVICLKCLSKAPAARYASAAELADDLRRYLSGEPIRVRPAGPGERLWRWLKRRFR